MGKIALIIAALCAASAPAVSQIIQTVVGGGPRGLVATQTGMSLPASVAVDASGNLYVLITLLGSGQVQKVTSGGAVSVVAGLGPSPEVLGDGGPAVAAPLTTPTAIAVDSAGNLYIADTGVNRVRKVNTTGIISTIAGNGAAGFSGDGGAATAASLNHPSGVAVDSLGNVYIADTNNNRIRKVSVGGTITTIVDTGIGLNHPANLALDTGGNLYVTDGGNKIIRKVTNPSASPGVATVAGNGSAGFSGDGGPATSAAIGTPTGVSVDSFGNLFIVDGNQRVRAVSGGIINTFAGTGTAGFSGDGGPATSAQLGFPMGVVAANGNLYIADQSNNRVRQVASGLISTYAGNGTPGLGGDGGAATSAFLNNPTALATDAAGNILIADTNDFAVRKYSPQTGVITTIAGNGTSGAGGENVPATSTPLGSPLALAVGPGGPGTQSIYIGVNGAVRKVDPSGNISTVPGLSGLSQPSGLAVDGSGDLFISDLANNRILMVSAGGTVTTILASGIANPGGLALDGANLFIADTGNTVVRELVPNAGNYATGTLSIVAGIPGNVGTPGGEGSPATAVSVFNPIAVAVNGGTLFFCESSGVSPNGYRVRRVTGGNIFSVAGSGNPGFSGDGGAPLAANMIPRGLIIGGTGMVYLSDFSGRVRAVGTGVTSTLTTSPGGLLISDNGAASIAPLTNTYLPGQQHTIAAVSPQGTGSTRYVFANWSDAGALSHSVTQPASPATYTATFSPQYALTLLVSPAGGGTLTANPPSGDSFYNNGTPVTLTATANAGYVFTGNTVDSAPGAPNPVTVNMTSPHTVQANFVSACFYNVTPSSSTISIGGGTGSFTISASSCSYTATSSAAWLTITSGMTGGNTGTINYSVASNAGGGVRRATITFGSQFFTVTQAGKAPQSKTGVFRNGTWILNATADGQMDYANLGINKLFLFLAPQPGDIPVVGDWNGDGRTKVGIFRNGGWFLDANGNGVFDNVNQPGGDLEFAYTASPGDIPIVGDWNGTGKTKTGIFRSGLWILDYNGDGLVNYANLGPDKVYQYSGSPGDVPIVGDWDGSGKTKTGIFRSGQWILNVTGDGQMNYSNLGANKVYQYSASPGDLPIVGDWNGSGTTKTGIFRSGQWILNVTGDGQMNFSNLGLNKVYQYTATPGDTPLLGDWDGSGPTKTGIFRNGQWILNVTGDGQMNYANLGANKVYQYTATPGDAPIVGPWVLP